MNLRLLSLLVLTLPPVQDDSRMPPPEDEAIKKAEGLIRGVFKEEYSRTGVAEKKALAKKLLQEGRDTKDEPALRFALYRQAQILAAQAGDLSTTLEAIDGVSRAYVIDALNLKLGAFATIGPNVRLPEDLRNLANAYLLLSEEAIQACNSEVALKAAEAAVQVARRAKDIPLVTRAEGRSKGVFDFKALYDKAKNSLETLQSHPDDPDANLGAGKFHCFVQRNWDKGLPCLAKGIDPILKELASKELSTAPTEDPAKMGDAWWEVAEKESVFRAPCRDRAIHWYKTAWLQVNGLSREKMRTRFRTASGVPTVPQSGGTPTGWTLSALTITDKSFAYAGQSSVRVVPPAQGAYYGCVESPRLRAAPGKQYTISAWVFADGNIGPRDDLFLRLWGKNGVFAGQPGPSIPLDQPYWTYITANVLCPEGIETVDVSVQMRSKTGVIWIDDISLKLDGKELLSNGSFEQSAR